MNRLLRVCNSTFHNCTVLTIAILLAGSLLAGGNASAMAVRDAVISVPGDFSTIQEAIDNASDGQTIEVHSGIYTESLFIDKDLTLLAVAGPGLTMIDADGAVTAVSIGTVEGDFDAETGIHPDFVRIEGFNVTGWTERGIAQRLGAGTVEIIGNQITATEGDTRGGITISGGQNSRIEGNIVLGTPFSEEGFSSTGIITVGSMDAEIVDNQVSGTDIGIALAAGFPGIDPAWEISSGVMVSGNEVSGTGFGIALFGHVLAADLIDNTVTNVSGHAFTVGPFDASEQYAEDLLIAGNHAVDFGTRAYSSATNPVARIELRDNYFQSSISGSWGIQLGDGTSDGLLTGNEIDVDGVALNPRAVSDIVIAGNDLAGGIVAIGMSLDGHVNNQIVDNRISGGVVLQNGANTDGYVLSGNELLGGAGSLGIAIATDATFSSGPLAGTCNWWDDPSGPSDEGTGQGSIVTEHVEFEPWNTAPGGPCDGDAAFADTLVAASATHLAGSPDTALPAQDLPTVLVLDQYGNPFEGATITFALQSSTGSISGEIQDSDGDGLAQLGSWVLGDEPEQSLTASATGLTGNPITFTVDVDAIFHDRFESP